MNKKISQDKSNFVSLFLNTAEESCSNEEIAKEFLTSEGINTNKLVSEGLKRIKKMQLLSNANRTGKEMEVAENVKSKAIEWVDTLLSNINFSLKELVQKEQISMSFRNVETLSEDDIRNILIRHFTLKLMNKQNDTLE